MLNLAQRKSNVRTKKDPLVLSVRRLVILTSSSLRIRSQIFVSQRGNERKATTEGKKDLTRCERGFEAKEELILGSEKLNSRWKLQGGRTRKNFPYLKKKNLFHTLHLFLSVLTCEFIATVLGYWPWRFRILLRECIKHEVCSFPIFGESSIQLHFFIIISEPLTQTKWAIWGSSEPSAQKTQSWASVSMLQI